ncbi:MAG: rhodanese-like domain-containing protein [Polyangiaceae bacterium]
MTDPKRVSPEDAHALVTNDAYRYVDVRSEIEFADGHPAGALNVPFLLMGEGGLVPNGDFLEVMETAFPKDAKLVLGCKGGNRSLRAAKALGAAGFTNIVDQRAGWDAARDEFGQVSEPGWSRLGLPVEDGATDDRSYAAVKRKKA